MAIYTGKQSVLDGALGQYKDLGFELVEPDDHLLELWFKDKRIAVFNQIAWTDERPMIKVIREGCSNFLAKILAQDFNACYGEELRKNA